MTLVLKDLRVVKKGVSKELTLELNLSIHLLYLGAVFIFARLGEP